jgi:hypothetical protein
MDIEICENSPMNAPKERSVVPEMAGLTPHNDQHLVKHTL